MKTITKIIIWAFIIVLMCVGGYILYDQFLSSAKKTWDTSKTEEYQIQENTWQLLTKPVGNPELLLEIHQTFSHTLMEYIRSRNLTPRSSINVGTYRPGHTTIKPATVANTPLGAQIFSTWVYTLPDSDGKSIPIAFVKFLYPKADFEVEILETKIEMNLIEAETDTGETTFLAEAWQYAPKKSPRGTPKKVRLPIKNAKALTIPRESKPKNKVNWINPKAALGAAVHYGSEDQRVYPAIGVDVFLSGYGPTKNDQIVKFLGVGVSSGEEYGSVHFVPAAVRISKYTPNTYAFISAGVSMHYQSLSFGGADIAAGIKLGF